MQVVDCNWVVTAPGPRNDLSVSRDTTSNSSMRLSNWSNRSIAHWRDTWTQRCDSLLRRVVLKQHLEHWQLDSENHYIDFCVICQSETTVQVAHRLWIRIYVSITLGRSNRQSIARKKGLCRSAERLGRRRWHFAAIYLRCFRLLIPKCQKCSTFSERI